MEKLFNLTLKDIPGATKAIAKQLAGGEVLALIGPLGSGKTTFTQSLAKQMTVKTYVTSPTFIIMNAFPATLPQNKKKISLLHLDLYRTKNFKEIKALGLTELWLKKDTVTVIEWADKIKRHLPKKSIIVNFHHAD